MDQSKESADQPCVPDVNNVPSTNAMSVENDNVAHVVPDVNQHITSPDPQADLVNGLAAISLVDTIGEAKSLPIEMAEVADEHHDINSGQAHVTKTDQESRVIQNAQDPAIVPLAGDDIKAAASGEKSSEDSRINETGPSNGGQRNTGNAEDSVALNECEVCGVKTVVWQGMERPVLMQATNGPCPLLAICNVLLLQGRLSLRPGQETVEVAKLLTMLAQLLLDTPPSKDLPSHVGENYSQNVSDALSTLPILSRGLDINVCFTGATHMEFTSELAVFDLLGVRLCHGWVVAPDDLAATALGSMTYNQVAEKVMACRDMRDNDKSEHQADIVQGLIMETFLQDHASQLTSQGLAELNGVVREGELAVLFRNNHFATLTKYSGRLFTLVTDQGFLHEPVVWESLDSIHGGGMFTDGFFKTISQPWTNETLPIAKPQESDQDADYLLALQLQHEDAATTHPDTSNDSQLAKELQQLEEESALQPSNEHPRPHRASPRPNQATSEHDSGKGTCSVM